MNDLDFNMNEPEYDSNIFNKQTVDPTDVYNRILNIEKVFDYEVESMDDIVAAV